MLVDIFIWGLYYLVLLNLMIILKNIVKGMELFSVFEILKLDNFNIVVLCFY